MIKKISIVAFALLAFGGLSAQAQATLISFNPVSQSVNLGEIATVDLRVSGLGDDILTAFDLNIGFDNSILDLQSFTLGTGLDTFGLGSLGGATDFGSGLVNVFEVSFDLDQDLKDFQPNDFVLGTFTFSTLSIGTSALDISVNALAGEFVFDPALGFEVASALEANLQSGSISVVPVPAAIWLFGSALIGLVGSSRLRKTP